MRVEPADLQGPRPLQEQTQAAVIRDYLQAWQTFARRSRAESRRPARSGFCGTARDKLAETIQQQATAGIHTRYQDHSHDIQIVFYSPEGLSIQLNR